MPSMKRLKTRYPGVFVVHGTSVANGKPEDIFYIRYRKNGKTVEEKAGRQFQDSMTAAQAFRIRSLRINGDELNNQEQREIEKQKAREEELRWTIERIWNEYKTCKPDLKGLKTDEYRYNKFLKSVFGSKEVDQITQFHVDGMRVKLLKEKSPQTVKHVMILLNRIINFGVKKQLCNGLRFKVEMPRVNNVKTEDLSPEELSRLLKTIDQESDIQIANLMRMALFTGMRRTELFKLKWKDIDFEKGFIRIVNPKGGINQTIPMNDSARAILESHLKTSSPYVFPDKNGEQRYQITREARRIRDRAELPKDFRPLHGLRHVYASMLASSGQVDMYTLQKLLTHKSPQMTQRYAHLRDDTLKQASNLMGKLVEQAVTEKQEGKQAG